MLRYLFLLLVVLLPATVNAEVKVIELKHRAAADLVNQVRDMLEEGEKVQAAGTVLIVRAGGESLQAAVKLAKALDRPPEQLIVRIVHRNRQQVVAEKAKTSVHFGTDNRSRIQAEGARRLGNSERQIGQSLRVQEGAPGWLEIGTDIPYTKEWAALSGEDTGYSEKIAYKSVSTGFMILPVQVVDDKVLVVVEPRVMGLSGEPRKQPPTIDYSRFHSRTYLPLGAWVELGAQLRQSDQLGREIIARRSGNGQQDSTIFIRIDRAERFSP